MKKRILTSLMVIGLVGALAGTSTMALFSDTENSNDNSFETGGLDLKLGWQESYNGEQIETQDLTNKPGSIFDFEDIKPGDKGNASVKVSIEDNPGWVWMRAKVTADEEIKLTEPEKSIGDTDQDGELNDELIFTIWKDDGDGVLQDDEEVIKEGNLRSIQEDLREGTLLGEFSSSEKEHIGIKWELPREVGNKVQKDRIDMDFQFYTEQRRHNDNPQNPWKDEPAEEPDDSKSEKEYYQVDLVGGEPIENLSESTYHSENRMQRFMHGGPGNAVDNQSEPDQVKTGYGGPDCVDSESFEVNKEEDTATVDFDILDKEECGTGTELSIVSYKKAYPGWIEERAGEQVMFDNETVRFEPGHHSMTVDIPDVNDPEEDSNDGNEGDNNDGDENEGDENDGDENNGDENDGDDSNNGDDSNDGNNESDSDYTAIQGDTSVEVEPLSGNQTVEELYDYQLPSRFDNEADNEVMNGATYPDSGSYYESAGTDSLQQAETSIMFLYDGPDGLSFVVVHDQAGGDGGSATWEISDLNSGNWVVKDDLYLNEDGTKASTNYDNWDVNSTTHNIDWTWGGGGTDGGAYSALDSDFSFTIDPAFNEESELYEEYYEGSIDDWQVLSGDMENPERTSLNMSEEVTIEAQ